jgi:imidazoleglycerol phosphate synthase glutamine amidotransferase subunit HisH
MKVAIIKYKTGTVQSALFMLKRTGIEASATDSIETIQATFKNRIM